MIHSPKMANCLKYPLTQQTRAGMLAWPVLSAGVIWHEQGIWL